MVRTGLEVALGWLGGDSVPRSLREAAALLRTGRLGLVTNPSAVTRDLTPAPDALRAAGARLTALFGPEHGVRGEAADGVKVPHRTDATTGIPIWSLYGAQQRPTPEMLAGLDAIVFDLQDVGARFYTFASTLSHVMSAALQADLPVIVLDRPNPLGGKETEGPVLESQHASFVGLHPIPIRHGATMGELGHFWAGCLLGRAPWVVPCAGWRRAWQWERTGLPWAPPSPAMPGPETTLLYPGLCLLEGTNMSEGRGTACPFRWFGAPWVDAEALAKALNEEALPGVRFRPVRYIPSASKHAGQVCAGCQAHVTDAESFRPVVTGIAVLAALRRLYPNEFQWRQEREKFPVDRLAGTSTIREGIEAGLPWRHFPATWVSGETDYRRRLELVSQYS